MWRYAMPAHKPAPDGHRELRAVWLSPVQLERLDRAAAQAEKSRAAYAEKALMERVERDLNPPPPDILALADRMRDLPAEIRELVIELLQLTGRHARLTPGDAD